jgi:predicted ATPase
MRQLCGGGVELPHRYAAAAPDAHVEHHAQREPAGESLTLPKHAYSVHLGRKKVIGLPAKICWKMDDERGVCVSIRIVLTGGPGAGKTVISRRIAAEHPERFVLVPEAATQVYDALQTRWDKLDVEGRRDVQRKIYRLQVDQEDRTAAANPDKILLLDRGTIDGAAYWPEGPADYWRDVQSTLEKELKRYDAVILLESSAALGLYDGDSSNFCRFEDAQGAIESGKLLLKLWGSHPNLKHVRAYTNLEEKIATVMDALAAV